MKRRKELKQAWLKARFDEWKDYSAVKRVLGIVIACPIVGIQNLFGLTVQWWLGLILFFKIGWPSWIPPWNPRFFNESLSSECGQWWSTMIILSPGFLIAEALGILIFFLKICKPNLFQTSSKGRLWLISLEAWVDEWKDSPIFKRILLSLSLVTTRPVFDLLKQILKLTIYWILGLFTFWILSYWNREFFLWRSHNIFGHDDFISVCVWSWVLAMSVLVPGQLIFILVNALIAPLRLTKSNSEARPGR